MRISPWMVLIVLVVIMLITGVTAALVYGGVRQLALQAGEIAELPVFDPLGLRPSPTPIGMASTAIPTATLPPALPDDAAHTPVAAGEPTQAVAEVPVYSDPGRVTILLLGIDQRGDEEGTFRTDTMIVLTLDPVRRTGAMLSIPRDLWVSIPGFQPGRINQANALGDSFDVPGGGPALAAATIQQNLGLRIDHTIRINFDLFLLAVDAIAPVEVCINETIHDTAYPDGNLGYMTVHFDPGCQDLDAERLLQYARTRHTDGGDFDRARRQQQVITAIRDRVLSLGGITSLIGQIPVLWEAVRQDVQTTLSLEEMISLGTLALEIPREHIVQAVLDNNYVYLETTSSGEQVLRLRSDAMRTLVQDLFNPVQLSQDDLRRLAASENVVLSVVNGTTTQGLASEMRDWLIGHGFGVAEIGNAQTSDYTETIIKDYTNNPYSARLLAALMGLPVTRVRPGSDNATIYDIQIVVGTDAIPLLHGGS